MNFDLCHIAALDDKSLTPLCKEIMCEITGKSEAELHTLFASKGWVSQTAAQSANPALAPGPSSWAAGEGECDIERRGTGSVAQYAPPGITTVITKRV